MATQAEMDRILGKALFDADFRELLLTDPEAAATSLDYTLTTAQAGRIRSIDRKKMEDLAYHFIDGTDWDPKQNFTFW